MFSEKTSNSYYISTAYHYPISNADRKILKPFELKEFDTFRDLLDILMKFNFFSSNLWQFKKKNMSLFDIIFGYIQ